MCKRCEKGGLPAWRWLGITGQNRKVHPQNVQLLDVQLQNVQLQNVHLPNVQLQNVQITKRPDYQTSLLPKVQITKRPVNEHPVTKRPH